MTERWLLNEIFTLAIDALASQDLEYTQANRQRTLLPIIRILSSCCQDVSKEEALCAMRTELPFKEEMTDKETALYLLSRLSVRMLRIGDEPILLDYVVFSNLKK